MSKWSQRISSVSKLRILTSVRTIPYKHSSKVKRRKNLQRFFLFLFAKPQYTCLAFKSYARLKHLLKTRNRGCVTPYPLVIPLPPLPPFLSTNFASSSVLLRLNLCEYTRGDLPAILDLNHLEIGLLFIWMKKPIYKAGLYGIFGLIFVNVRLIFAWKVVDQF